VGHYAFCCRTRLMHMRVHSYVWSDSFVCLKVHTYCDNKNSMMYVVLCGIG